MPKPGADPSSGISLGDALRLPKRPPACRRREAQPGSCTERENLDGDVKGKAQVAKTARPKVQCNAIFASNPYAIRAVSGIELDSNFSKCQAEFARGGRGVSNMPVILSDLLLFGFIATFTTWLIIEVAKLLS